MKKNLSSVYKLLDYIGQIEDAFLDEAQESDVKITNRTRLIKYGALAATTVAVASVVFWLVRPGRVDISKKSA